MMLRSTFSFVLACLPLLICSDVVKSAVAKKQIEIAENAPAFDNPYITDGLVAMYDGEWNAGTTSTADGHTSIYTVRVYDRVLTEDEIMHNYLIDKERFDLQ